MSKMETISIEPLFEITPEGLAALAEAEEQWQREKDQRQPIEGEAP